MKMLLLSGFVFLGGLVVGLILAGLGFWIWVRAEPPKIPTPSHTGPVHLRLADPDAGERLEKRSREGETTEGSKRMGDSMLKEQE
jgi:hypothetical protein